MQLELPKNTSNQYAECGTCDRLQVRRYVVLVSSQVVYVVGLPMPCGIAWLNAFMSSHRMYPCPLTGVRFEVHDCRQ